MIDLDAIKARLAATANHRDLTAMAAEVERLRSTSAER